MDGVNHFQTLPVAFYGVILLMSAVASSILHATILRKQGAESLLAKAIGKDIEGKLSVLLYVAAIGLSYVYVPLAGSLYVLVAVLWLVPDRRIEAVLADQAAVKQT